MEDFPKANIKPIVSRFFGPDGCVSIEVELEPFKLCSRDYSENFNSSIRLDGIEITNNLKEIENKTIDFPINPEDGYIDGSIYFYASHNPIDVKQIEFGKIKNGKLPIKLLTSWVLEFESTGFKNFETSIETYIQL